MVGVVGEGGAGLLEADDLLAARVETMVAVVPECECLVERGNFRAEGWRFTSSEDVEMQYFCEEVSRAATKVLLTNLYVSISICKTLRGRWKTAGVQFGQRKR